MTCEFVSKNNGNRQLIVIFAGWSTDTAFYSHVVIPGWDTLVVSGYTDMDFPSTLLDGYADIALFAWSLGVYAASVCFPFERACLSVAINGTEHPVSDSCGIPEAIFTGTAASLNERNLTKFRRRMAGKQYGAVAGSFPALPTDALREQLEFIAGHHKSHNHVSHPVWNRVYISGDDMIFPASSQKKAWSAHSSQPHIIEIDEPHYVDLLPIIKAALPLPEAIGRRFEKAMPTYNSTATPQQTIARHLVDLLSAKFPPSDCGRLFRRALEIGPGSGFLSRHFAEAYHPGAIDFVDLFQTDTFNVAPEENYFVADAELWMADAAEDSSPAYDIIISASTIQWFANPRQFFQNAAKCLKPGGVFLCSTFLPGNLEELTEVNPYGIIYRSSNELSEMLKSAFRVLTTEEETITTDFRSSREVLSHLIKTGVGGSSGSSLPIGELLRKLPTRLTYHPLYILAKK